MDDRLDRVVDGTHDEGDRDEPGDEDTDVEGDGDETVCHPPIAFQTCRTTGYTWFWMYPPIDLRVSQKLCARLMSSFQSVGPIAFLSSAPTLRNAFAASLAILVQ